MKLPDQWPFPRNDLSAPWLTLAVVAGLTLIAGLLVVFIWRRFRRRARAELPPIVDLGVDVSALSVVPTVETGLTVEVYGTPVRLAVVIVAPVGRDGVLPTAEEFPTLIDQLVPGFGAAVMRDQPLVRIWEGQLSSQGFANAFAKRVPLPGERGKGTPWCSIVGKFSAAGCQYLVGIVGCGAGNNALSQYAVEHEGKWNDLLRVRRERVR